MTEKHFWIGLVIVMTALCVLVYYDIVAGQYVVGATTGCIVGRYLWDKESRE